MGEATMGPSACLQNGELSDDVGRVGPAVFATTLMAMWTVAASAQDGVPTAWEIANDQARERGRALEARGEHEKAAEEYAFAAGRAGGRRVDDLVLAGRSFKKANNPRRALWYFRMLLDPHHNPSGAHGDEARRIIESSSATFPIVKDERARGAHSLARSAIELVKLKSYDRALGDFERAYDLLKHEPWLRDISIIHALRGNWEESKLYLARYSSLRAAELGVTLKPVEVVYRRPAAKRFMVPRGGEPRDLSGRAISQEQDWEVGLAIAESEERVGLIGIADATSTIDDCDTWIEKDGVVSKATYEQERLKQAAVAAKKRAARRATQKAARSAEVAAPEPDRPTDREEAPPLRLPRGTPAECAARATNWHTTCVRNCESSQVVGCRKGDRGDCFSGCLLMCHTLKGVEERTCNGA